MRTTLLNSKCDFILHCEHLCTTFNLFTGSNSRCSSIPWLVCVWSYAFSSTVVLYLSFNCVEIRIICTKMLAKDLVSYKNIFFFFHSNQWIWCCQKKKHNKIIGIHKYEKRGRQRELNYRTRVVDYQLLSFRKINSSLNSFAGKIAG